MRAAASAQPGSSADTRLRGGWLLLARVGWIALTGVTLGLDIIAIPVYRTQVLVPCARGNPDCLNAQLTVDALRSLPAMGIPLGVVGVYVTAMTFTITVAYVLVGAVIFWRRSDDLMAFFASFTLVAFGGAAVAGTMQALPATNAAWYIPTISLDALGQSCFFAFFLLFPDGRFVPRWTYWLAVINAAAWMTAFFPGTLPDAIGSTVRNGPAFVVLVLSLMAAQVYRYRRVSNASQREQTKWVVYGFTVVLTVFSLILILSHVLPFHIVSNGLASLVATTIINALFILIPISIAVAMQRSRLYDIDALINRTLVYGSLTALLALIYVVIVYGVEHLAGTLLRADTSTPAIVASTLLIAALFNPLRHRLQSAVDRRFYRRKYDAARTLSAFSATLRGEVDLSDLTAHLMRVVDETMRPAHISLWLREPVAAASGPADAGYQPPTLEQGEHV